MSQPDRVSPSITHLVEPLLALVLEPLASIRVKLTLVGKPLPLIRKSLLLRREPVPLIGHTFTFLRAPLIAISHRLVTPPGRIRSVTLLLIAFTPAGLDFAVNLELLLPASSLFASVLGLVAIDPIPGAAQRGSRSHTRLMGQPDRVLPSIPQLVEPLLALVLKPLARIRIKLTLVGTPLALIRKSLLLRRKPVPLIGHTVPFLDATLSLRQPPPRPLNAPRTKRPKLLMAISHRLVTHN